MANKYYIEKADGEILKDANGQLFFDTDGEAYAYARDANLGYFEVMEYEENA